MKWQEKAFWTLVLLAHTWRVVGRLYTGAPLGESHEVLFCWMLLIGYRWLLLKSEKLIDDTGRLFDEAIANSKRLGELCHELLDSVRSREK